MDISFIIINWNTRDLLLNCLRSILDTVHGYQYEIFVVDNGSRDGSPEAVKNHFGSQVQLIENHENLGFARANNQALKKAQGRYVVLLNSDAVLKNEAVSNLVSFLESTPSAAMAGPRLLNEDGSPQNSFDNFPALATELLNKSLMRSMFPAHYGGKRLTITRPFEVDSLIGACIALRHAAIQQVGLLDEDYFFFLEETDWCFRMRRAGWKIFHCPQADAIHLQGQSKQRRPAQARVEYYRSLYLFFKKNRSAASYLTVRIFRFLKLIINFLLNIIGIILTLGLKKRLRDKTATYAYILWWHFLLCPDSWGLRKSHQW
jgi:hypothetical protein